MKTLLPLWGAFAALLTITACSSPVQGAVPTPTQTGAVGDARLDFHFTSVAGRSIAPLTTSHTLSEVQYLTVQLTSAEGLVRFASATKAGDGSYSMIFPGLVAGDWKVRALLYDSPASGQLLFYAAKNAAIQVGRATTLSLEVYQPGSLTGTITEALVPTSASIEARGAPAPQANLARSLGEFQTLVLTPLVWNDFGNTVLASSQDVQWSSSNEDIATVSSHGVVTGRRASAVPVAIEARSTIDPTVLARFFVLVVPAMVGDWESVDKTGAITLLHIEPAAIYRTQGVNRGDAVTKTSGPATMVGSSGTWTLGTIEALDNDGTTWSTTTISGKLDFYLKDIDTLVGLTNGMPTQQFSRLPSFYPITSVTLSGPTAMTQGQSASVSASIQAIDELGQPVAPTRPNLYWVSSDPSLVTVDQTGNVRVEGEGGSAIISAWSLANKSTTPPGQLTITVSPLPVVTVASSLSSSVLSEGVGRFTTVQPDSRGNGGWYASGMSGFSRQAVMARFAGDGTHDTGFGNNAFINAVTTAGISQVGVFQIVVDQSAASGFAQNGNGVFVLTPSYSGWEFTAAYKLGYTGTLDQSYNDRGIANDETFGNFRAIRSPVADAGGDLYQLGLSSEGFYHMVIKRLPASGDIASTATTSNDFWVSDRDYLNFTGAQMARQSNGAWIVAGTSPVYLPNILRLDPNGSISTGSPYFGGSLSNGGWTGFGVYLKKDHSNGVAMDTITTLQIDGSDRIVLGGTTPIDGIRRGFVARLTANGVIDATFGGHDGIVDQPGVLAFPAPLRAPFDLVIQDDGSLVVVGDTDLNSDGSEVSAAKAFVVRVKPDGSGLDSTFQNPSGGVLMDGAGGYGAGARSVAIDAAGHIAVAGFTRNPTYNGVADTLPALWRF